MSYDEAAKLARECICCAATKVALDDDRGGEFGGFISGMLFLVSNLMH